MDDTLSDAAWTLARQIVRDTPPVAWPELPASIPAELAGEVRRLLNEMFFYACLWTGSTAEAAVNVNGLTVQFPSVAPYTDASRLISFETMLPFRPSPAEAIALAERFRGISDLCYRMSWRNNPA